MIQFSVIRDISSDFMGFHSYFYQPFKGFQVIQVKLGSFTGFQEISRALKGFQGLLNNVKVFDGIIGGFHPIFRITL